MKINRLIRTPYMQKSISKIIFTWITAGLVILSVLLLILYRVVPTMKKLPMTQITSIIRPDNNAHLHNDNFLQIAEETVEPNMNFLYASNASLLGRLYMTFSGKVFKTCINTVTSFFNEYHTCSNCEDFIKKPEKWNFRKTEQPKVGDIIIQHNPKTGRAYHAVILVRIEGDKYYINHAIKKEYFKNVELKNKANLTFYEYIPN
jgi:hypothetical protein